MPPLVFRKPRRSSPSRGASPRPRPGCGARRASAPPSGQGRELLVGDQPRRDGCLGAEPLAHARTDPERVAIPVVMMASPVCDHNAPMKKRDRVMAALRGEPVDRVPLSFWLHNFTAENAVESFVAETLRLAREFDWDYLKPQSRAQCFAEAWGSVPGLRRARHAVSRARTRPARVPTTWAGCSRQPVGRRARRAAGGAAADPGRRGQRSAHHLDRVLADDGRALSAGRRRRAGAGHRARGAEGARGGAGRHRPYADQYARLALAAGADGLFYATNVARPGPALGGGVPALPAALRSAGPRGRGGAGPFTALHVCGAGVHFDEFADYPAQAFSWALGDGNPSLREAHRRTGRAVMGGLPAKPVIATLTPAVMPSAPASRERDERPRTAARPRLLDQSRHSGRAAARRTRRTRRALAVDASDAVRKRSHTRFRAMRCSKPPSIQPAPG